MHGKILVFLEFIVVHAVEPFLSLNRVPSDDFLFAYLCIISLPSLED